MDASFPLWWEAYPSRLQWELDALESAGVGAVLNEDKRDAESVIELSLDVPDAYTHAGSMTLRAVFPDTYPYFPPTVFADGLALTLHQQPFQKNLCLLGQSTGNWAANDDLASLLSTQLEPAIRLGTTGGGGDEEIDQGEPFSAYYAQYAPASFVGVDSEWDVGSRVAGWATLAPTAYRPQENRLFSALVEELHLGDPVLSLPEAVLGVVRPTHDVRFKGRWTRLDCPPNQDDARAMWNLAVAVDPVHPKTVTGEAGELLQYRLICYPEQHARSSNGLGWILLVRQLRMAERDRTPNTAKAGDRFEMVRSLRMGREDIATRIPAHLKPLAEKSVALIGVGALGGTTALQLAKNGLAKITLVDRDVMEPGNITRHVAGIDLSGLPKTAAVGNVIARSNPFTHVEVAQLDVTKVRLQREDGGLFLSAIANADLVIDASAEVGIQELTSMLARRFNKDWLMAEATNGAWGGSVVAVPADSTACFSCLEWARSEGEIRFPPASEAPPTQPIGCAEPTFQGTSFDLDEVSLQAVRVATRLLQGTVAATPTIDVVELPHEGNTSLVPKWEHFEIEKHPSCLHDE